MPDISFARQTWVITPAATLTNTGVHPVLPGQSTVSPTQSTLNPTAAQTASSQKWLLVLSGVAIVGVQGTSTTDWFRETLQLTPDTNAPLDFALTSFSIPKPKPPSPTALVDVSFQVEQSAPFATINSIFDQDQSINAGFAVDDWRLIPSAPAIEAVTNHQLSNIFIGLQVDVAVRDSDATLYRVGYNITLLGKIVFTIDPL